MENPENKQEQVIPSISLADNKIIIATHDIPLDVDGQVKNVKVRKLTAGERRDLIKQYSTMKIVGTQQTGTIDGGGYQIGVLTKVIVEAPFSFTEEEISKLPSEVIDYLFEEYEKFAEVKKKD